MVFPLRAADGQFRTFLTYVIPLRSAEGQVLRWFGTNTDITDAKRIEEKLRELNATLEQQVDERSAAAEERAVALAQSEQALRYQKQILSSVLNSIGDAVVVADQNGKFLVFNPSAERILGTGASDTPPEQWPEQYGTFLPDGKTRALPSQIPLIQAMRGEATNNVELLIRSARCPEGTLISINGRPLQGSEKVIEGGVVVFRDITARKQTEARLRESEEIFRSAFDFARYWDGPRRSGRQVAESQSLPVRPRRLQRGGVAHRRLPEYHPPGRSRC